ncbi:MAG: hypothetical protein SOW48_00900 [Peptoniphilaceae bacterium]|nr:hypothetical protein [Peptoniphilaceae bacterium]MDY3075210.1 hypothetical protein [Peptoniphilaceae bacterium]MDY3986387.1 hypothetical protein [Peptoniphilaceae bacterium]
MKKILSILLTLIILIIPSNILAKSANLDNTEIIAQEILNDQNISKETKEWLVWFNSLSAKDQQYINYRPLELSAYNYEKKYIENPYSYSNEFSNIDIRTHSNDIILPTGKIHQDLGNKILPIGGYEKDYAPTYWNRNKLRANCYTYALNYLATTNKASQQPGYASGKKYESVSGISIINAVKRDVKYLSNVKGFRTAGENEKPGYREYKVALVIAPGKDYHWYKQDSDGYWSHKPGNTNVTRADSQGRSIINPRTAYRNYSYANYSTFIGYYFVKY